MFAIVYGDIRDLDYVSATGPFATEAEAEAEGERLTSEHRLPDESSNGGEDAWRVVRLTAPASLPAEYDY